MALSPSEVQKIDELHQSLQHRWPLDEKHYRYATMQARIEQLGMAIPPSMRRFLVVANWPRVVLRTIISRQQVRSLILPGEATANAELMRIFRANNMSAQLKMFRRDLLTYGRSYLSVASNPGRRDTPLIRAESPREIECEIDPRTGEMVAAARFYSHSRDYMRPTYCTFYKPNYTVWLEREQNGRWRETDRRTHNLGRIPFIMHLNEQWSGRLEGESELTDIIPFTDSTARSLTNLQFAQEAHGIPRMWMSGVAKNDFIDPTTGEMIPMFEAYFDAIHMVSDPQGRVGQLTAADLKNFETAVELYGKQASIVTGFPARLFGITTANPATEGAIIADEIQLVRNIEDKNESEGVAVGWAAALVWRIATGQWIEGNEVDTDYISPATPTVAQLEDALQKRRSSGVLSREGYWDELGWSEARKAKERDYLKAEWAESVDPTFAHVMREVDGYGYPSSGG